jgi:hypothetical protein
VQRQRISASSGRSVASALPPRFNASTRSDAAMFWDAGLTPQRRNSGQRSSRRGCRWAAAGKPPGGTLWLCRTTLMTKLRSDKAGSSHVLCFCVTRACVYASMVFYTNMHGRSLRGVSPLSSCRAERRRHSHGRQRPAPRCSRCRCMAHSLACSSSTTWVRRPRNMFAGFRVATSRSKCCMATRTCA